MIGREKEINELENLYHKNSSTLLALYGRRRIGKTYLINHVFNNRLSFKHTGLSPLEKENLTDDEFNAKQLEHFYNSLLDVNFKCDVIPKNWMQAMQYLKQYIKSLDQNKKQVIFIDELPWLDYPKSDFFLAFEGFWNNFGSCTDNLLCIICGSATSWMLNKIINNHGGLYGRVNYEMKLSPFTLLETEEYFLENEIVLPREEITKAYMAVGGIPYYLGYFEKGESLAQNINRLFFEKNAKLQNEFNRLFASVFNNYEQVKKIVILLSKSNNGYNRKQICERLNISDGGSLSEMLNSLIACDFLTKYYSAFASKRDVYYKLVDPFCIFYLKFVQNKVNLEPDLFKIAYSSPAVINFYGHAFENVCFNHTLQIKKALGIEGVVTEFLPFKSNYEDDINTQIDMIIIRNDRVINICEIKFKSINFIVDSEYYVKVCRRQELIETKIPKKYIIVNTLICSSKLAKNSYSGVFNKVITLDDLFK